MLTAQKETVKAQDKELAGLETQKMVALLCQAAKLGLRSCYDTSRRRLPYSIHLETTEPVAVGSSIRYAAISQIGISRWCRYHPDDADPLCNLLPNLHSDADRIIDAGDCALCLWAAADSQDREADVFAKLLADRWRTSADRCNAVELSWVVQACTVAIKQRSDLEALLDGVLEDAYGRLCSLFNSKSDLFNRHARGRLARRLSGRIACFADQVYPILACANYGRLVGDQRGLEMAGRATEQICRYQGPMGQWWWHYDVVGAKVCEEYPVFSVHQDAMAPMAIRASDRVNHQDHSNHIESGLRWIFGANELGQDMLYRDKGLILRDIEKTEPAKASRFVRSILCAANLNVLHKLAGKCVLGFRINRQCRPYHLGWILYAWADYQCDD